MTKYTKNLHPHRLSSQTNSAKWFSLDEPDEYDDTDVHLAFEQKYTGKND